ncbi:MAG TPA: substrate-binding domain-containing protein [Nitrospira sp.]|nr:substrate-binding domain-containing protein [Nitrospira sp.]
MSENSKAEPTSNVENRLKSLRIAKGLSQWDLAQMAGLTRQAVYAIETSRYLPTTAVALRLAKALGCRVEDMFSLISDGAVIEGELVGSASAHERCRVKVAKIGDRTIVRPVAELGEVLSLTVPADGLLLGPVPGARRGKNHVKVELLRDHRFVEDEIIVAGCDPAIFLVGEYVRRRHDKSTVVGWTMGSVAALDAVKRREVHVAGLHVQDVQSGEWNLPFLRKHLASGEFTVVTFVRWEAGLMVQQKNPKRIHDVGDLDRKELTIVNREPGSGARELLDRRLRGVGLNARTIKGYESIAGSHVEVARRIAAGLADAGIGLRSVARLYNLEFIPLQDERYDLVIPAKLLAEHSGLAVFFDTIVSRVFRSEIESLGGYDTRETGTIRHIKSPRNA